MMYGLPGTRQKVEMQGFVGLDDDTLAAVEPWLRLSPAICMVWAATGTALGSAATLFALVPFALAGAVFRNHPFDAIYTWGIRRLTGGPPIPTYHAPRRFACAMASTWLVAAGLAFALSMPVLGTALGGSMALAAGVPVTTGFCIPSWIFSKLVGSKRSALTSDVEPA